MVWAFALMALLWPQAALAAGEGEPSLALAALKMVAALAVCLGLLFGGVHLLRRFKLIDRIQGEGIIKVVATRPLGPKRYVSVVEVAGRLLILGVAEGGVTLLDRLPNPGGERLRPGRLARLDGEARLARGLEDDEEL